MLLQADGGGGRGVKGCGVGREWGRLRSTGKRSYCAADEEGAQLAGLVTEKLAGEAVGGRIAGVDVDEAA